MKRKDTTKIDERGFTLIELLIVVAIVAILAAVAIPQFTGYRAKAVRSSMLSDAKNAATALDAYYADTGAYPGSATTINGPDSKQWGDQTVKASSGNTVKASTLTSTAYTVDVYNSGGGSGYTHVVVTHDGKCQYSDTEGSTTGGSSC